MRNAWLSLALLSGLLPAQGSAQQPPATPVRNVVDTLHGTPVGDPYRWLEDLASPEVQAWFRAQNAYARATLEALPGHAALLQRRREIDAAAPPDVSLPREAGGYWFYTMRRAGESVARGYIRDSRTGDERLLVDPATVGGSGGTGTNQLTFFAPSPDGRLVLYGITTGGTEQTTLRVRDVTSGRDIEGPIERNQWQQAWWDPRGRAFYYLQVSDVPADRPPSERLRDIRVLRHRPGEDITSDVVVLSAAMLGEDPAMWARLEIDPRGELVFGNLLNGAYYVAPAAVVATGAPTWRPLFGPADSVADLVPHDSDLFVLTQKGGARIVRTRLDAPDLRTAETVMTTGSEETLQNISAALDGLYVQLFSAGSNRLVRIPWGGSPIAIELPHGTSVAEDELEGSRVRTDPFRSGALLTLSSWTAAPRDFRYDPATGNLQELSLLPVGPFDRLDGYVTETLYAPSHDSVRVPLTLVRPDTPARDGSVPIILEGYGASGLPDIPQYGFHAWYESGGATATCHVRGGGYYGRAWHLAGQRARKPNSWLDFIACAEYLVREGYTRPERLVAGGGSAGGITVGRALTERPALFAGAIISNGTLDMVRNETTPIGVYLVPEFGSVETEDGFRALLAMSSYHHVQPGTAYPAVLLEIGMDDIRVGPWASAKTAAAFQAATSSGRPVLLRVQEGGGHQSGAISAEQRRLLSADNLAFWMAAVGLPAYRLPDDED